MTDRVDEIFGVTGSAVEGEVRFYPGSRHQIPEQAPPPLKKVDEEAWDAKPIIFKVKGEDTEFFTIGMLAKALNRSPATVREWEAHGVIPVARFRTANKDPKKAKRLYTRAQCEAIIRIAQEEGLMASSRAGGLRRDKIPETFTQRVLAVFKEES